MKLRTAGKFSAVAVAWLSACAPAAPYPKGAGVTTPLSLRQALALHPGDIANPVLIRVELQPLEHGLGIRDADCASDCDANMYLDIYDSRLAGPDLDRLTGGWVRVGPQGEHLRHFATLLVKFDYARRAAPAGAPPLQPTPNRAILVKIVDQSFATSPPRP